MRFPFVDLLFFLFVAFYGYRGYQRGVLREGLDLVGFLLGILLALRFYSHVGKVFELVGVGAGWAAFLGGALIFALFVVGAGVLSHRLHPRLVKGQQSTAFRVGGSIVASVWAAFFAVFIMVLLSLTPTPSASQRAIRDSLVGKSFLSGGSPLYVLQGYASTEGKKFLVFLRQYFVQLEPHQNTGEEEFFSIQASQEITVDASAEKEILRLVNEERRKENLAAIQEHAPIREVARAHSSDMYKRGYFAHTNPDGKDPFDRIREGGVTYELAGENLALAPTVEMVHRGLMNSPRHKENIMKPEFSDLGIGVYRGPLGFMVTQNFCSECR